MKMAALVLSCVLGAHAALAQTPSQTNNWTAYGGVGQTRYSPLKQITRQNVNQLKVAWTYDATDGPIASQTQPIVLNGVLYGITPSHKTIAIDAATGKLLWRFDSGVAGRGPNRGLIYWTDGAQQQRIFSSVQSYIYALDARTGKFFPASETKVALTSAKA
jgi:quinoprotein glucose dehydrogenase